MQITDAPLEVSATELPWWKQGVWWMAIIVAVAVVLRLGLLVAGPAQDVDRARLPDSGRYITLAENLVATGSFGITDEQVTGLVHTGLHPLRAERGELEAANEHGIRPEIVRTPGYPGLLASVMATGLPLTTVLLIQCVLGICNVMLVYAIAKRLLNSTVGAVIAAAAMAIHPACIVFNNVLLSETLFVFCVLSGMWISLLSMQHSAKLTGVGGLVLGLSVLVRPISIVIGPGLAIWMMITKRRFAAGLLLLVCSLVPVGAWVGRQVSVGAGPMISSIPNINAWYYTAAYMNLEAAGQDAYHDWPRAVAVQHARLRGGIREGETTHAAMKRLAIDRIKREPTLYVTLLGRSVRKMMLDPSVSKLYHVMGQPFAFNGLRAQLARGDFSGVTAANVASLAITAGWTLFNTLLAGLMVVGLARLLIARQWSTLLLLGCMLFYFVFATQTNGLERFRVPIIGLQAITAAATFVRFGRRQAEVIGKLDNTSESDQPYFSAAA